MIPKKGLLLAPVWLLCFCPLCSEDHIRSPRFADFRNYDRNRQRSQRPSADLDKPHTTFYGKLSSLVSMSQAIAAVLFSRDLDEMSERPAVTPVTNSYLPLHL